MFYRIFLGFLFLILLAPQFVTAQHATAWLDPTNPSELPSAVSWRFGSALGIQHIHYYAGSGTDKYANDAEYEISSTATRYLLSFQPSKLSIEASGMPEYKQIIRETPADGDVTLKQSEARLNLAVRGQDRLSIGLAAGTKRFEKSTNDVNETYKFLSGSVSMRLMEVFYLAYGIEHIQDKSDGRAGNSWADQHYALGIMVGSPKANQYRFEYSITESPESLQEGDATSDINSSYKLKSTTKRYALEVLVSNWYFSYSNVLLELLNYDNANYFASNDVYFEETSGIKASKSKIGVGYKTQGGLFLSGNYIRTRIDVPDLSGSVFLKRDLAEYSINLGYSFF